MSHSVLLESPASLWESSPPPLSTRTTDTPLPGRPLSWVSLWLAEVLLFPPGLPDNPPPPGLIMLGLFLVHYDPRKALSDCPTDRDQISSTCLPCWWRVEGVYTQQNRYLIDWPGSWAEGCPSECQRWEMECASPPSLINTPLGPDSIKWGVRKHRDCCHCPRSLGTGFQLQQCGPGPSRRFHCPPSALLPTFIVIIHVPSLKQGANLFAALPLSPVASFQGSKSVIFVWG